MTGPGRSGRLSVTSLPAMTGHCHAALGYGHARQRGSLDRPAPVGPARRMLMPGLLAQPAIYVATGRQQVTMTDCNEQSVII